MKDLPSQEFYAPGSLLTVQLDTTNPLALGLPSEIAVWNEHSPAWQTEAPAVARYPESNLLASGWLLGGKASRRAAAPCRCLWGAE